MDNIFKFVLYSQSLNIHLRFEARKCFSAEGEFFRRNNIFKINL